MGNWIILHLPYYRCGSCEINKTKSKIDETQWPVMLNDCSLSERASGSPSEDTKKKNVC